MPPARLIGHGPSMADEVAAGLRVSWIRAGIALSALSVAGLVKLHRSDDGRPLHALPLGVRVVVAVTGVPEE